MEHDYELLFNGKYYRADDELENIRSWKDYDKSLKTKGTKVAKNTFQNIWRSTLNHLIDEKAAECKYNGEFCIEGCIYFVLHVKNESEGNEVYTYFYCVDNGEGVYLIPRDVYNYYHDMSIFKNDRKCGFNRFPDFDGAIFTEDVI